MKNKIIFCIIAFISLLNIAACQQDKEEEAVELGAIEGSLINGHPVLEDIPFFLASIGDMCGGISINFKESYSEEQENGYLHFFQDDGIIYVCGEPSGKMKKEYKTILGVILSGKDKFELACGIKVGMQETELLNSGLEFKPIMKDEISPETVGGSHPYINAVSKLFDFDKIYWTKREVTLEECKKYDEGPYRDIVLTVFVKDGEVTAVSADNSGKLFHEFSISDILIKDHPVFRDRIWWWTSWDMIEEKCPEEFEILYSEEGANGHFTYKIGEGITYFSGMWGGDICAIMLTSDKYSFDCGLKVGMTEEELKFIDLPFEKYAKEEIGINVGSTILGSEIGPVSMVDFDSIYYFDQGCMNTQEAIAYCLAAGIPTDDFRAAGRTGLIVFLKNGVVTAICTEIPV